MVLHVPTLYVVMIATSLALAIAIVAVAYRRVPELSTWAGGLFLHSFAYLMLGLRSTIGPTLSIIVGNVAIAGTLALLNISVFQFLRKPISRLTIWAPVAVIAVSFPLLLDDLRARLFLASLASVVQFLTMAAALWQHRRTTFGNGQYIVLSGATLVLCIFVFRMISVVTSDPLPEPVTQNIFEASFIILAIIGLIICTSGILLMSQERAMEALSHNERKFRMLTESMKDVVWTLDVESLRFTYVSPSVQALRGYTPDEIMAEPMDAALSEESRRAVRTMIDQQVRAFREGQMSADDYFNSEVAQPCKDGSEVWTEVITHYRRDETTGRIQIQGVTRDITTRKQAEDALRRESEKSATLLRNASDGIHILDTQTRVVEASDSFCAMLGYSREENYRYAHRHDRRRF
jgi:PAS domain S-box-containing protein